MSNSAGIPGGTENAVDSIEPLEPGRHDVMPNPPADGENAPGKEGEIPSESDKELESEEDMSDVDAFESVDQPLAN